MSTPRHPCVSSRCTAMRRFLEQNEHTTFGGLPRLPSEELPGRSVPQTRPRVARPWLPLSPCPSALLGPAPKGRLPQLPQERALTGLCVLCPFANRSPLLPSVPLGPCWSRRPHLTDGDVSRFRRIRLFVKPMTADSPKLTQNDRVFLLLPLPLTALPNIPLSHKLSLAPRGARPRRSHSPPR